MAKGKSDSRKARLLAELEENPLVSRACNKAKVHRSNFYRWCSEDQQFKAEATKAIEKGRSKLNDFVESKLLENISNNQYQSIALWLRHNTVRYHPPASQDVAYQLEHLKKIVWTRTEMINTVLSRIGIERFEKILNKGYKDIISELDKAYEKDQIDKGYRKPGHRAFEPHLKYPDEIGFDQEDI